MRTDAGRSAAGLLLLGVFAASGAGQEATGSNEPSLLLVDTETRVESVGFRFLSGTALREDELHRQIATRGLGPLAGVQERFDFLPGISTPVPPLFSPLALQKDVARIRDRYRRAGFEDAAADYDVALDTASNLVRIDFVVDQGEPLVVDSVTVRWAGAAEPSSDLLGGEEPIPPELEPAWVEQLEWLRRTRGWRLGEYERAQIEIQMARWFLDRGYPWVTVTSEARDTVGHAVDLDLLVRPGPRARVDQIVLEGHRRLSEKVIRREVPIEPGDWYDERDVTSGESELYELELVRRALGGIDPGQPRDTTVTLRFRIEEGLPRTVWGRAGWRSEAGVAGEAHWAHRDFLGGARTLTASAVAETGWAALEQTRGRSVGVSATVRQPYLLHTRVSGTIGPFVRFRDDFRDRSLLYGLESAAIYKAGALETVTLQHELSRLGVDNALVLLPVRELVDRPVSDYSPVFVRSVFRLRATYGRLDDRLAPRLGFLVEPSVEVTAPGAVSDVDFLRLSLEALGALPISRRVGIFLRGSGGRLFPFGDSDPRGPAGPIAAAVGLRGTMFTAGGTADVRGWGGGMLGPKVPDVRVGEGGLVGATRYLPVGGLMRVTASLEVGLPFPFLPGGHRTFVFLDSGRVWSPGNLFEPPDPELALEPWGLGAGAGAQLSTPVGPVRLSVGYKLNPSRVDLLSPGDVTRALASGGSLGGLQAENLRRWHLHLAVGRSL
ncbi:MAG TPA: BamA/TamA family outer membrane protein [Longimicrobiales bacterium]|nr:BamA/TamA family outer membrane protein [Longimicrobiales bacterium]